MTKEQYKRACEINTRLKQLEQVQEEIRGAATHRLTYTHNHNRPSNEYVPCSDYVMSYIGRLLDKHAKIIRTEIRAEIAALEQEIEAL